MWTGPFRREGDGLTDGEEENPKQDRRGGGVVALLRMRKWKLAVVGEEVVLTQAHDGGHGLLLAAAE